MKHILIFILIICVIFLAAEISMRAAGIGSTRIYTINEQGVILRKSHTRYLQIKENRNVVHYNNLGFHDKDRAPKNPSAKRIIIIGDSMVEGSQVPKDMLFTMQAEALLNGKNMPFEIINAGVSGTGTAYQYTLWQTYLKERIQTNMLMLCLYLGDDLAQNNYELFKQHLGRRVREIDFFVDEDGGIQKIENPKPPLIGFARKLTDYSRLLNYIYQKASALIKDKPETKTQTASASKKIPAHYWEQSIQGTLSLIELWKRELDLARIDFALMIIPPGKSLAQKGYGDARVDEFVSRLKTWSDENQTPLLEVDFSGIDAKQLYYFEKNNFGHFAPDGHTETAKQLSRWIENF